MRARGERCRFSGRTGFAVWFFLAILFATAAAGSIQQELAEFEARLQSGDPETRRDAARELGRMETEDALRLLSAAADDANPRVRAEIFEALLKARHPGAVPGLLRFLESERAEDRGKAIRGLVDIHAVEARPGPGLRAMNWLLRRSDDFVLDPLRPVTPDGVAGLTGRLQDSEESIRRLAAESLGFLRAESAVEALAAAALDPDRGVAEAAIFALGEVGYIAPEAAGTELVRLLEDARLSVPAIEALGAMGFESAGPRLLELYDEDTGGDRGKAALWALSRMGYEGAMGTFIAELTSGERDRRESAAAGLGRIGNREMVDGLIRDFLREEDRRVQLAYCFALVLLGETPFVDRLVTELSDQRHGDQARDYALELGEPLVDEFIRYLDDPDRGVRLRLVELLERIGSASALPALQAREADPDPEVAGRIRSAIRRLREMEEAETEPSDASPRLSRGGS